MSRGSLLNETFHGQKDRHQGRPQRQEMVRELPPAPHPTRPLFSPEQLRRGPLTVKAQRRTARGKRFKRWMTMKLMSHGAGAEVQFQTEEKKRAARGIPLGTGGADLPNRSAVSFWRIAAIDDRGSATTECWSRSPSPWRGCQAHEDPRSFGIDQSSEHKLKILRRAPSLTHPLSGVTHPLSRTLSVDTVGTDSTYPNGEKRYSTLRLPYLAQTGWWRRGPRRQAGGSR